MAVKNDAALSLARPRGLLIPKAFIHFHQFVLFIDKADPTHPHRHIAINKLGGGLGMYLAPIFDTKAGICGISRIMANKIGERTVFVCAEGLYATAQGRFEQDRPSSKPYSLSKSAPTQPLSPV